MPLSGTPFIASTGNAASRSTLARLIETHWRLRRVLYASARVELQKRHAGSLLGAAWAVLYPILFLSVYLFLWLVVFRVRFPGSTSSLDYVVFVFAGLVPYLFLVESMTSAVVAIRQNIYLVKGVIMPVELLPTRSMLVALAGHAVGLVLLLLLTALTGGVSVRLLLLPFLVGLLALGVAGICWILAPLGVLVPDTAYVVNLAATLLMFVSPIAFKIDMVPARFQPVVWLNPVTYVVAAYRYALLPHAETGPAVVAAYAALMLVAFVVGALFCCRFKRSIVDFE